MNIELFRKILDRIKADPSSWRQDKWVTKTNCGTAYCFAGHIAADMGHMVMRSGSVLTTSVDWPDHVGAIAEDALGISSEEAEWLFAMERTIKDFERVLELGSVAEAGDIYYEVEDEDGDDEDDEDEDGEDE